MKIALGTVQWGMRYGISNKRGIPSDKELDAILTLASEQGINLLDTASAYGNAENRIGVRNGKKFRIITKIGSINKDNSVEQQVKKSLENLKTTSLYGCLFHNVNELLNRPSMWKDIQALKKEGRIKKIGYSLYEPEELEKLLDLNLIPDIVQFPYSLLDRKFESYFTLLELKNVEIHVRSVYLQGLYFKDVNELPKKLISLKPILQYLQSCCLQNRISMTQLCLSFIKKNPMISYAVVGVEKSSQLLELFEESRDEIDWNSIINSEQLLKIETALLNPSNW